MGVTTASAALAASLQNCAALAAANLAGAEPRAAVTLRITSAMNFPAYRHPTGNHVVAEFAANNPARIECEVAR